jgi:hypothetical protein
MFILYNTLDDMLSTVVLDVHCYFTYLCTISSLDYIVDTVCHLSA